MTSHLLSFVVFLPLVGALLVLLVPNRDEKGAAMVRQLGLVVSLVVFFFTLLLWGKFDASSAEFQFVEQA
jgi:NADH-quinone oxidoreductase subunit M